MHAGLTLHFLSYILRTWFERNAKQKRRPNLGGVAFAGNQKTRVESVASVPATAATVAVATAATWS